MVGHGVSDCLDVSSCLSGLASHGVLLLSMALRMTRSLRMAAESAGFFGFLAAARR